MTAYAVCKLDEYQLIKRVINILMKSGVKWGVWRNVASCVYENRSEESSPDRFERMPEGLWNEHFLCAF